MNDKKWISSQYFVEGVLIVVSILIAFAIDAWWDERQERAEEKRILMALKAEFRENADRLPVYIGIRERDAEHMRVLIDGIQAAGEGATITATAEQLMSATVHGSYDPVRGAFDAMLQSGELRYIQNQELRQRLVRWPTLVADAMENDHFLRTVSAPRALDYLSKRVDLGLVDLITRCKAEQASADCPAKDFELTATPELSSLLSHVRGWSAEGAAELDTVRLEALALVRALDEELARL